MNPGYQLRSAQAEDAGYIYEVTERIMRGHVEATWGSWLEAPNREQAKKFATGGVAQIIESQGQRAGLLVVMREATHIQLEQIFLTPEYQHKGIGTAITKNLQAQGHRLGLPLRLRVLRVNPAKMFYEGLGFMVISETAERFFMESKFKESKAVPQT